MLSKYSCFSIFPILVLFSCNEKPDDIATSENEEVEANLVTYSESKYGPFEEAEYTEWQNVVDFQIAFEAINLKKKWVFDMQGRNHQGLSQYRMVIKERPDDVKRYQARNGMTYEKFWNYGIPSQRSGYKRVSLQLFKDSDGVIRHQALWFEYKAPKKIEPSTKGTAKRAVLTEEAKAKAFGIVGRTEAAAQDICHFNKVKIPRNESRLLELASVIEFRCEPTIPKALIDKAHGNTQFLVERYQDGKCVSREFFSDGKHSSKEKSVISFGWNMDKQKLVGVNDTGFFRLPGSGNLPNFHSSRPRLWLFFRDSKPEPREAQDGLKFDLYPIIGIRGSKARGIDANGYPPASTFNTGSSISSLPSKELVSFFRKQPDSIIVYLYLYGATPKDYAKHISEKNGTDNPIEMEKTSSTFKVNGISLTLNGLWEHVDKSSFGYVVRPKDANIKKVRIHSTRFKGVSLKEALNNTSERTKKNDDITLAITKIKTNSGIEVMKASVAKTGGKVYLERYFCQKPKGDVICICVYSFGDETFSKAVEKAISHSLRLTK